MVTKTMSYFYTIIQLPSNSLFGCTSPFGVRINAPLGTMRASSSISEMTYASRSSSLTTIC